MTEETFRINNSQVFEEGVTAYYAQTEFNLLKSRLKVLTGVRYEATATEGLGALVDTGAVWARNANGTFVRNAAGLRIRRADAGAVSSMEQLRLTHQERNYRADRGYGGYYPSLHVTYNVAENLIGRAAWAQTYGRPNLNNLIPTAQVDEADLDAAQLGDPSIVKGNITVTNTGLRPWSADNYDFALEYYSKGGGLFSAGVFLKDIKNFFANTVRIANPADLEAFGLDPRYSAGASAPRSMAALRGFTASSLTCGSRCASWVPGAALPASSSMARSCGWRARARQPSMPLRRRV